MLESTIHCFEPTILQQTGELTPAINIAIETIFNPVHFVYLLLGILLGLIMGVLPGLGGPVALALLIPITFKLNPNVSIMILAATLGGVAFGGSVTAILFNTPGDAPNAATILDGYPLAQQGRATEAISTSAFASAGGAIVGLLLLLISIPLVRQFALAFHSVDIFWLAIFGLITIAVVSRGGILANMIAGLFGLILAFHGLNPVTGTARFTWGIFYLRDGIRLIPLIIGLFAVAEMLKLASRKLTISNFELQDTGKLSGAKAILENKLIFAQSSLIGWLIGVIPGAGGTVANFIAYLQAQNISADPHSFGTGNIQGVIASESANDAKDGGSMIPTLGLGIPGSASTAVLLGAFIVNGIIPGPLLFQENLQLVFIIVFALLISNIITSAIGIVSAAHVAKLTRIPPTTLVPVIVVVALMGAFVNRGNFGDVTLTILFGILGFYMIKFNMSRIPVIIAFVLGPIAEQNFHRGLQISRGDYFIFFDRTVSLILILSTLIVIFLPVYRYYKRSRTTT